MAMRLHETAIQDPGLRVQQIHQQLQNLCLEMQRLKQDRAPQPEVHEELWCVKSKGQGHEKYHCPIFVNYLARGGPMPLRVESQAGPRATPALWCAICQVGGVSSAKQRGFPMVRDRLGLLGCAQKGSRHT